MKQEIQVGTDMKLEKNVYGDGQYEWQTEYLGCRLTFGNDLQRLQIQPKNAFVS